MSIITIEVTVARSADVPFWALYTRVKHITNVQCSLFDRMFFISFRFYPLSL